MEANHVVYSPEEIQYKEGTATNSFLEQKVMIRTRTELSQTKGIMTGFDVDNLTPRIPLEKSSCKGETAPQLTNDRDAEYSGEDERMHLLWPNVVCPPMFEYKALRKQHTQNKERIAKNNCSMAETLWMLVLLIFHSLKRITFTS